jgi:hypothetical protein
VMLPYNTYLSYGGFAAAAAAVIVALKKKF